MGTDENKAVARRLVEGILNEWDAAKVDEAFADDFVNHQGGLGATGGREELKQFMGAMIAAFPDARFKIKHLVAEGDLVSIHLTLQGTHSGEFQGIAATGRSIEIAGMGLIRIANGRVVERWNVMDVAGLTRQLTS